MPTPIKKTNYFSYLTKYNSFEVKIWNTSNFTSIAHSDFTINISTRGHKGYMLPLQGGWVFIDHLLSFDISCHTQHLW